MKYEELLGKVMDANVAMGLEKEQKGERFTLIDPARLPVKPYKPNRLAIVLIGLVLGVGAGVGFAALREFSDQTIHAVPSMASVSDKPVLVVIPEILTPIRPPAESAQTRGLGPGRAGGDWGERAGVSHAGDGFERILVQTDAEDPADVNIGC